MRPRSRQKQNDQFSFIIAFLWGHGSLDVQKWGLNSSDWIQLNRRFNNLVSNNVSYHHRAFHDITQCLSTSSASQKPSGMWHDSKLDLRSIENWLINFKYGLWCEKGTRNLSTVFMKASPAPLHVFIDFWWRVWARKRRYRWWWNAYAHIPHWMGESKSYLGPFTH